jgi:hypothetical protein
LLQFDNFNKKRNNSQKNKFIFVKTYHLKQTVMEEKSVINLEIISRIGVSLDLAIAFNPVIGCFLCYRKYILEKQARSIYRIRL